MRKNTKHNEALDAWLRIPEMIEEAVDGLSDDELDADLGQDAMTARETVHHIAEAIIVASSMIIAALGASGSTYDWSWLYPDKAWIKRLGYSGLPIGPALETVKALCRQIANLVSANADALRREVTLFDKPGAETYTMSVADILRQEAKHAEEHLSNLREKRKIALDNQV